MRNERTNRIVITAMFVSLVMASTYIGFSTPGSMGGYVHFGTLVMLAIALKYGRYYGALAGGIGMTLFDLFSPWLIWAPGTFVVRIVMGYVVGLIGEINIENNSEGNIIQRNKVLLKNIFAIIVGALIMMPGYFVYQAFILGAEEGGYAGAVSGIPGNATQFLVGLGCLYLIKYLPSKKELGL